MGCPLEELAGLTESVSNVSGFTAAIASERENQAKLLDALIWMNSLKAIFFLIQIPIKKRSVLRIKKQSSFIEIKKELIYTFKHEFYLN